LRCIVRRDVASRCGHPGRSLDGGRHGLDAVCSRSLAVERADHDARYM